MTVNSWWCMIQYIIIQYTVRGITVRGNTEDFTCGRAVSFKNFKISRDKIFKIFFSFSNLIFFKKFFRKREKFKMNIVRGTSIYLRRPGSLESKRNDWWRNNERFSVQVSTKTNFCTKWPKFKFHVCWVQNLFPIRPSLSQKIDFWTVKI